MSKNKKKGFGGGVAVSMSKNKKKGFERLYPNERARQLADHAAAEIWDTPGIPFLHVCARWLQAYEEATGFYK